MQQDEYLPVEIGATVFMPWLKTSSFRNWQARHNGIRRRRGQIHAGDVARACGITRESVARYQSRKESK